MSQYVSSAEKAFPAVGAIAQHLRVRLTSDGHVAVAVADDDDIGTATKATFAAEDVATVRLLTAQGTTKMVASAAISAGRPVFAAAGGKIAQSGTKRVGLALEDASADGDVIEVLRMELTGGTTTTG